MLALFLAAGMVQPTPPVKPKYDRIDWALLAADAGVRTLDVYSTQRDIKYPGAREDNLPQSVAKSTPELAAYSGGVVALDYFVSRYLVRHHHPKLAKVYLGGMVAYDGEAGIHNMLISKPVPNGTIRFGK